MAASCNSTKEENLICCRTIEILHAKSREPVDKITRRRINIACLQETNWEGSKSTNNWDGYKIMCRQES